MATAAPYDGTGTKYNNGAPGVPVHEAPRRAHRVHHCVDFILRVLTALATAAAIVTILKSNQSFRGPGGVLSRARWRDFGSFKWFLVANAVVCAYSILAAIASLFGICFRHGPLSVTPITWLTFLVDFLLANALMSAAASATTIAWIGYKGQSNAGWASQCGVVRTFCHRVGGALIASYAGWVFLALSTLVAASALHKLRRRTDYR